MLISRVKETLLKSYIFNPSTKIVLGYSGGPDSVCLLDILSKIGYPVIIAYFNHQLRSEVEAEIQFVKKTAETYKKEFIIGSENIPNLQKNTNQGIEETARFYRYQFLFKTAEESSSESVFVAHHADDQVETILMNMIRGTGLNGLIGMHFVSLSEFSNSIPIVRPMLEIWKEEIFLYCKENNLEFMVDETNAEEVFTRNKIRGSLLPTLEEYNPKIKFALTRMGTILQDDYKFLLLCSEKALIDCIQYSKPGFVKVNIPTFRNNPISIQRNIINHLLHNFFNVKNDLSFYLIENIRSVLNGETASSHALVLQDLHVLAEKDSGFLYVNTQDLLEEDGLFLLSENTRIMMGGTTSINDNWVITCEVLPIEQVKNIFNQNNNMFIAYLDANAVGEDIILQKSHKGIRYAPFGMSGHSMKLSDFWINKGFPKRKRENWPLIISKGILVWVPGFQPAYSARITASTKQVLRLCVEKNVLT